MATSKTLFDALEGELRNARAAINNAGAYMNMVKDAVNKMEKSTRMEALLSLKSKDNFVIPPFEVKCENKRVAEYGKRV